MSLVQIVPHLPPPPEGLGGHAQALGAALRERCHIDSRFVVCDPRWEGDSAGGVLRLPARTRSALAACLEEAGAEALLLHYANYGYQRRGCPVWLVDGVRQWRARGGGRRLVTIFHEVYATGPPWRSSFWLSPLQRRLAAELAVRSDALTTSLALYAQALRRWVAAERIAVLPVASTVGEPGAVPPLTARRRRLVVFGSAGVRGRAYGPAAPELVAACRALGIDEILDVGPAGAMAPPAAVAGVPVRVIGTLPAGEVSALLLEALGGFLAYPPAFLAKSTIFAAYCAHGALPVCTCPPAPADDGLRAGRHYWRPGQSETACGPADPQAIADAARSWYREHALNRQAEVFCELLA